MLYNRPYFCNINHQPQKYMKSKPEKKVYCVYIEFEPYLYEWLLFQSKGKFPVYFPKLSIENRILQTFLMELPPNAVPVCNEECAVPIGIPKLKNIDPEVHNYLPIGAKQEIHENVRHRFIIEFWGDIHRTCNIGKRKDKLIEAFMETHGIEVNDKNYNTLHKIYMRERANYYKRKQRSKSKKSKRFQF